MIKAIFLSFALMLVFGSVMSVKAQTNQQIKLAVKKQKTVTKDKLTVKFVSVMEDSRCPIGVDCIWAGNAKIQIKVTSRKGISKTFELNTGIQPQTIQFEGYEIKLGELSPHPKANVPANPNGYTANFVVSKS
jgi:hypothetical protein